MSDYAERCDRIARCKHFIEIEGTEWGEFYSPILVAAERGNGGGFDEEAEMLVRIVERAIDWIVARKDYGIHYGDEGAERETQWRTYRKEHPSLPIFDPETMTFIEGLQTALKPEL